MAFPNMPASNKTGSSSVAPKSSGKMASGGGESAKGMTHQGGGKMANMPTGNGPRPASHPSNVVGTTKHGVGQVPGYLKGC